MTLLGYKHVNGKLDYQMICILNNNKYGSDAWLQSEVCFEWSQPHLFQRPLKDET